MGVTSDQGHQSPENRAIGRGDAGGVVFADAKKAPLSANVARRYSQRIANYEFPPGAPELRRQIALRTSEQGCPVDPNDIQITNGCQEA